MKYVTPVLPPPKIGKILSYLTDVNLNLIGTHDTLPLMNDDFTVECARFSELWFLLDPMFVKEVEYDKINLD